MQPHASPGIIVPAKILSAATRNKIDEALDLLAQAAELSEIDVSALQEAVALIDKLGQGDAQRPIGPWIEKPRTQSGFCRYVGFPARQILFAATPQAVSQAFSQVPRSCGICIRARFAALTPFCVSLHLNRPLASKSKALRQAAGVWWKLAFSVMSL